MRDLIKIVEGVTGAVPDWFSSGEPVTAGDLDRLDASEFIQGSEWDYQWRFCLRSIERSA